MNTKIKQNYQDAYAALKKLVNTVFRIDVNIQNKEVDSRDLEVASRLFAKIISHARTILILAPKKPAGIDAPSLTSPPNLRQ